jgi:aryl-alcohol dehydrogenase-like predicted oxidoreductase
VLHRAEVTSALIGASRTSQIEDVVSALGKAEFSADDWREIEAALR